MTKEERRAYSREYYRKNREKILAEYRERYANDADFRKAKINSAEIYNETNKDKIKERKSKYYEKIKTNLGNILTNTIHKIKTLLTARENINGERRKLKRKKIFA